MKTDKMADFFETKKKVSYLANEQHRVSFTIL